MLKGLLLIFSLLLCQSTIYCQDSLTRIINQKSIGLLVEYGQPYYYLPEGTLYYIAIVGGKFGFPLFKAKKNVNLSLDLYPHYVQVWVVEDRPYYEFGLNIRLCLNFSLSPNDLISAKTGCGPHYITAETEKQANGFIFSDYLLAAYTRSLMISGELFAVEFEFGYRHISNAGIKDPNGGISNFIFGLGMYKYF